METIQSTPSAQSSQNHHKLPGFFAALLFLLLGFLLAGGYFYVNPPVRKTVEKPVVQEASDLTLPSDAVKISECVPYMGEHWVQLESLPRGPIYATHGGKVIGVEYMFATTDIPGNELAHMSPQEGQKYAQENNLTFGDILKQSIPDHIDMPANMGQIKTWDIEWAPPHVGFVEPHYDVHFYFVDKSELENICPTAAFGSELPPEMAENLKKLGVTLP